MFHMGSSLVKTVVVLFRRKFLTQEFEGVAIRSIKVNLSLGNFKRNSKFHIPCNIKYLSARAQARICLGNINQTYNDKNDRLLKLCTPNFIRIMFSYLLFFFTSILGFLIFYISSPLRLSFKLLFLRLPILSSLNLLPLKLPPTIFKTLLIYSFLVYFLLICALRNYALLI